MECEICGQAKAYNRAIVDKVAETEVGHLCRDCESDVFGKILETNVGTCNDGCILCNRDATVVLPAWHGTLREQHGRVVNHSTYTVSETTPGLCDEHAQALLADQRQVFGRQSRDVNRPAEEI